VTARHAPPVGRAPDESMTLLTELTRRPLDPSYADAAARRAVEGDRRGAVSHGLAVLLAALLGVGVAAAALALRTPTAGDRQARALLEHQVLEKRDVVDALEASNARTASEVTALQESALRSSDPQLLDRTRPWAVASALAPVVGAGLRIVLTDAAGTADNPDDLDLRVQDVDLQVLVNGLWAAGAEAVAVNGQRVGPTTAIRSAGSAVLVDLVPLVGPYTVEVIGDAPELQTRLARSTAGQHMAMLHATYGIGVQTSSVAKMELPGSGSLVLREATVPDEALAAAGLADAPAAAGVRQSGADKEGDGS